MTDIAEDQAAAAERIVAEATMPPGPSLTDLLANVDAATNADTAFIVGHAINLYLETIGRMGGRNKLSAQDVTRLFTIINLYLEGGMAKVASADYAPRGRPSR